MAAKKDKDEGPEDVIDAGLAQGGTTATGTEASVRSGEQDERIDALESRGGPEPEEDIKPDAIAAKAPKNVGLQKESAEFVVNGSIPPNSVASNSGLVPVGAIVGSAEDAEARVEEQKDRVANERKATSRRRRLTDADIEKHSGAELRAVAHDRGYEISDSAGTRAIRRMFATQQADDDTLDAD